MNMENSAITRKLNKFMPWLNFWSKFKNMVSIGIKSVPPPIPNPPNTPEITPASTYKKYIIFASF